MDRDQIKLTTRTDTSEGAVTPTIILIIIRNGLKCWRYITCFILALLIRVYGFLLVLIISSKKNWSMQRVEDSIYRVNRGKIFAGQSITLEDCVRRVQKYYPNLATSDHSLVVCAQ